MDERVNDHSNAKRIERRLRAEASLAFEPVPDGLRERTLAALSDPVHAAPLRFQTESLRRSTRGWVYTGVAAALAVGLTLAVWRPWSTPPASPVETAPLAVDTTNEAVPDNTTVRFALSPTEFGRFVRQSPVEIEDRLDDPIIDEAKRMAEDGAELASSLAGPLPKAFGRLAFSGSNSSSR
ncbi:MAG: hypothetical protein ACF8PN_11985 [Phycisphaerales bacterium]